MRYTSLLVCLLVCALVCEAGTSKKQTRTRVQKKLPNRSSGSKCTKCGGGLDVGISGGNDPVVIIETKPKCTSCKQKCPNCNRRPKPKCKKCEGGNNQGGAEIQIVWPDELKVTTRPKVYPCSTCEGGDRQEETIRFTVKPPKPFGCKFCQNGGDRGFGGVIEISEPGQPCDSGRNCNRGCRTGQCKPKPKCRSCQNGGIVETPCGDRMCGK